MPTRRRASSGRPARRDDRAPAGAGGAAADTGRDTPAARPRLPTRARPRPPRRPPTAKRRTQPSPRTRRRPSRRPQRRSRLRRTPAGPDPIRPRMPSSSSRRRHRRRRHRPPASRNPAAAAPAAAAPARPAVDRRAGPPAAPATAERRGRRDRSRSRRRGRRELPARHPPRSLLPADEPAARAASTRPPDAARSLAAAPELRPPPRACRFPSAANRFARSPRCASRSHVTSSPARSGPPSPGSRARDDPQGGSTASAQVEGRQETSGRRGPADRSVRKLRSGVDERRLQRLARIHLVVAALRTPSRGARARAAPEPLRPRALADHASARRHRSASPSSTRVAPTRDSHTAGHGRTRAGSESCEEGVVLEERMEDR